MQNSYILWSNLVQSDSLFLFWGSAVGQAHGLSHAQRRLCHGLHAQSLPSVVSTDNHSKNNR